MVADALAPCVARTSIGPPIPEIRLFQNLTLTIQGQGHPKVKPND